VGSTSAARTGARVESGVSGDAAALLWTRGVGAISPKTPETHLWHVAFYYVRDVPELLITGREREYFTWWAFHYLLAGELVFEWGVKGFVDVLGKQVYQERSVQSDED
jgi:hypothetical protein